MARPRRKPAVAHRPELAAHGMARDRERELVPNPLRQISKPPTHDAVCRWDWPGLDYCCKLGALLIVQNGGSTWRLKGRQTTGGTLVKPDDPVAHDLQRDTGDLRRFATPLANQGQGQRQQPPDLIRVTSSSR